jgi:soluble lytic murein transglycosylase-like protein
MKPLASSWCRPLINAAALEHGHDPVVIEAMVLVESGGKADAFREEPAVWRNLLADKSEYAHLHPRRAAGSYGLMQVLYSTARDMGLPIHLEPEVLFFPENSLEYGCRYLAWLRDKKMHGKPLEAHLAAYNGGPRENYDPPYRNREYVAKVKAQIRIVAAAIARGEA